MFFSTMIYLSFEFEKKNPDLLFRFYDILSGLAGQKCDQMKLGSLRAPEAFGKKKLQKLSVLFFKNMSILCQDLQGFVKKTHALFFEKQTENQTKTIC